MTDNYVVGNVYDKDAPPAIFNDWLVGPLHDWAKKERGDKAAKKRAGAEKFALLSTQGARRNVEAKVVRLPKGEKSERGRIDKPGITTLVVVMSGQMNTVLVSRTDGKRKVIKLKRAGDFLVWRSSAFNHGWESGTKSVSVTMRWSEGFTP